MLKSKIAEELNKQMNREVESSYIYLAMSAYCNAANLAGCASWFEKQAAEELEHAMKFYHYLVDQGAKVRFLQVPEPRNSYDSITEVFEAALTHEEQVTAWIENLANLSVAEKDMTTYSFLGWFLNEQVEEVATATSIVEKLKMVGGSGGALLFLDSKLGQRE